jgi:catechol 2,3-dioxygenase-like lactoylglutathione lyase family enzyme
VKNEVAINHLNLVVSDIRRSLEFYVKALGFKYVRNLNAKKIILEYGGFDFFIEEAKGVDAHPRFHFGIKTTEAGVYEFAKLLRSKKIPLVVGNNPNGLADVYVTPDRVRHVLYFADPDGYIIEVYSHIGNS